MPLQHAQPPAALCAEGQRLLQAGRPQEALDNFQRAIDAPGGGAVEAHIGQAHAYDALGATQDAVDSLEIALALDPSCVDALLALARLRRECSDAAAALAHLHRAIELAPSRADLRIELGLAQSLAGNTPAAIQAYRDAMALDYMDPAPMVNLGLLLLQQVGDVAAAEALFRQALTADPTHLAAIANLGLALHDTGRYDEAFALYEEGLERHPNQIELRWNRAVANLSIGNYAAGWRDYDLRLERSGGRRIGTIPLPTWQGEPLSGALLILAEQGIGDEVMFASCLRDLAGRVDAVVLECAPRLERLFTRSFPNVTVRGADRNSAIAWTDAYPSLAAKICIGSLPGFFRHSSTDFPKHKGYLVADPARTAAWTARLRRPEARAVVGVSWKAGTRGTRGALRSVDLDVLAPLFEVPDVRFVSVQHGVTDEERAFLDCRGVVVPDDVNDIDDLAALIASLDLVVTVANTNAHLAGALGRSVWVWLNAAPEWRWLRTGSACPWYPSATLYRSAGRIESTDILARRQALAAWAAAGAPGRPAA